MLSDVSPATSNGKAEWTTVLVLGPTRYPGTYSEIA